MTHIDLMDRMWSELEKRSVMMTVQLCMLCTMLW